MAEEHDNPFLRQLLHIHPHLRLTPEDARNLGLDIFEAVENIADGDDDVVPEDDAAAGADDQAVPDEEAGAVDADIVVQVGGPDHDPHVAVQGAAGDHVQDFNVPDVPAVVDAPAEAPVHLGHAGADQDADENLLNYEYEKFDDDVLVNGPFAEFSFLINLR